MLRCTLVMGLIMRDGRKQTLPHCTASLLGFKVE
jgi:hypothetical protein